MTESGFLELISGKRQGLAATVLRGILWVLSWPYRGISRIRNWMFDNGLRRVHSAAIPVVSVGNLTTGGTGKTPFVAFVVGWLLNRGIRPGIISRGYRAINDANSSVAQPNDEKLLLDRLCPGVPHVQNRDRVAAAREAHSHHNCQFLIADDCFQHRRLARDVDIVLIDSTEPFGYGFVLPRGLMRESASELRRASLVVLTRCEQSTEADLVELTRTIRKLSPAPVLRATFEPARLRAINGSIANIEEWRHRPVGTFCGVGNPSGFRRTVANTDARCVFHRTFPDHHHYVESELVDVAVSAKQLGAEWLATTAKDLVKVSADSKFALPVFAVDIELRMATDDEDLLFQRLDQIAR